MFAEPDSSLRGKVTYSSLNKVLAHIHDEAWPADLISMTGDISQDKTRGSYSRFKKMFSVMGVPVYCVPGNHDDRALMQSELDNDPFIYCGSAEIQNWLVIGVDSCLDNEAAGRVGTIEMARLEKLMCDTAADSILVCLHHPPLPVGSRWLDQVGLRNGREYLDLLGLTGKVRATIFGHVHQTFDETHAGIRILGTPSTCRQFEAASDEFAVDDHPPAYRRISLYPDGTVESELIWVAEG